jgi:multimeric flavodoxin WrbA
MATPRILLVFYSRTRRTRRVAHAIQTALELRGIQCDLEQLREQRDRCGPFGYVRSGFEAWFRRPVKLLPMSFDARDYDVVIIGTPIWNASVSSPVRTFLEQNSARLKRVAFFLTYGGMAKRRVLSQLHALAARPPIAGLAVREREVDSGDYLKLVEPFADAVAAALRSSAGSRAIPENHQHPSA